MNDSTVLHKSVNKVFIAWTCATIELLFLVLCSLAPRNLKRSLKCSDVKSLALALKLKSLLTTLDKTPNLGKDAGNFCRKWQIGNYILDPVVCQLYFRPCRVWCLMGALHCIVIQIVSSLLALY